jgi:hypothetical protein
LFQTIHFPQTENLQLHFPQIGNESLVLVGNASSLISLQKL